MTIYTLSCLDDLRDEPTDLDVLGSWRTRGEAIRKCAEYIIARAQFRPDDIGQLIFTDENHPDIPHKPVDSNEVFDYLVDEIGGQGAYCMYHDWCGSVKFFVDENELAD